LSVVVKPVEHNKRDGSSTRSKDLFLATELTMNFLDIFHRPLLGYRLLAWSVSILMLCHGVSKLMHGADFIGGMLQQLGLPGFLAYGVYLGEVVAPVLVLLGIAVRPAAFVMAGNMVVAVALAHMPQLATMNPKTGGYALELQALYFFGALAIALMTPTKR
jgi:putative oxidoreductase